MLVNFIKCQGSGNDFPLIDARGMVLGEAAWAELARALADREGPVGGDGLLLLTAGDAEHCFGMRMFNPDGSEAETCLNGLRCVARLGFETFGINAARVRLKTSSAEVAREAALAAGVVTVRTSVHGISDAAAVGLTGMAGAVVERVIDGLPTARAFTAVAMPNPHLVAFVARIDEAELVTLGDWVEAAPALIPARANVSFVEVRGADALFVRTYERAVGLTDSCGSAMAAATFAAGLTNRVAFGTVATVFNRGGLVRVTAEADGRVSVSGNATFLHDASVEFDLASGMVRNRVDHERRTAEVAAWEAVLAGLHG